MAGAGRTYREAHLGGDDTQRPSKSSLIFQNMTSLGPTRQESSGPPAPIETYTQARTPHAHEYASVIAFFGLVVPLLLRLLLAARADTVGWVALALTGNPPTGDPSPDAPGLRRPPSGAERTGGFLPAPARCD